MFAGVQNFDEYNAGVMRFAYLDEDFLGQNLGTPDTWDVVKKQESQPVDITGAYLAPVTAGLGLTDPIFLAPDTTQIAGLTAVFTLAVQSSPVVERYLFESLLNSITSLMLPEGFESLLIEYNGGTASINPGETFTFGAGGVTSFSLIPLKASSLSPDQLAPYTLGFTFQNEGIADLQQTVVTSTQSTPTAVPEPGSAVLLATGMAGLGLLCRRCRSS